MIEITEENYKDHIGETLHAHNGTRIVVRKQLFGFWDGKAQVELSTGLYNGFEKAYILTLEDCF